MLSSRQGRKINKNHERYRKGDGNMSKTNLFIYHEGKSMDLCKFEIWS